MSDFKNVYYIYSSQRFLLEEALSRLKKSFIAKNSSFLDCEQFYFPKHPVDLVLQSARTVSLSDQKKLIIYWSPESLSSEDQKKLIEYLKKPVNSTVLVIASLSLSKKSALEIFVRKQKYFYEYVAPKKSHLTAWISDRFKRRGKVVNYEACHFLFQSTGDNLADLSNEIEKICLYYLDKKQLNLEDISDLIADHSQKNIFDLVDAIGKKNSSVSLSYLTKLIESENPIKILSMITRHFRLIYICKSMLENGCAQKDIGARIKLPPFLAGNYIKQSANFSFKEIAKIYSMLADCDYSLKTGALDSKSLLEMLIVRIVGDGSLESLKSV